MAEDGGKRSRWRGMLSKREKDNEAGNLAKETEKLQANDDVMDFLAPSIAKATAMGTRASPMKMPKLDVTTAQRFPGAQDLGNGSPESRDGAAPLPSGRLSNGAGSRKKRRRPGLRVTFATTPPDVIGEGGDEAELPVMAVGKVREHKPPAWDKVRHGSRDDTMVGHRVRHGSRDANILGQDGQATGHPYAQINDATSPGLRRAMTHGHEHTSPPQGFAQPLRAPTQQQQSDPFADGTDDFRPKPLARTATGWSEYGDEPQAEDSFQPKPLARTPTGWSDVQDERQGRAAGVPTAPAHAYPAVGRMDASAEFGIGTPSFSSDGQSSAHPSLSESPERYRQYDRVPEGVPTLPEIDLVAEESPSEFRKASTDASHWLAASPTDPNSFSAKLIHKMRSEEGRALHDYVRNSVAVNEDTATALARAGDFERQDDPQPPQLPDPVAGRTKPPILQHPRPPIPSSFSYQPQPPRPPLPPQSSYPPPQQAQQQLQVANVRHPHSGSSPVPPAHMSLTPRAQSPASHNSNSARPTPSPMAVPAIGTSNYFGQQGDQYPKEDRQYVAYSVHSSTQPQQVSPSAPPMPAFSQDIYSSPPQQPDQVPYQATSRAPGTNAMPKDSPKSLATRFSESAAPVPLTPASTHSVDSDISFNAATQSAVSAMSNSSHMSSSSRTGPAAVEDFAERVQHMSGIFRLTAEVLQPASKYTAKQWLRCCLWWFLRGRAGLEVLIQARQRGRKVSPVHNQGPQIASLPGGERLCQAHVDLAKVIWMVRDIFPSLPSLAAYYAQSTSPLAAPASVVAAREAGDIEAAQVLEGLEATESSLKALLAHCSKAGGMPPHASLIQGQDQSIWVQFPTLPRDAAQFVSSNPSSSPLDVLPVTDTTRDFAFGRMFVNATVMTPSERLEPGSCTLSIMRERNTWGLKVTVCSQTEAFTLVIQDEHERSRDQGWGPGWRDVQWDPRNSRMVVDLMGAPVTPASAMSAHTPHGRFSVVVDFAEADYIQLVNIWNYTRSVSTAMLAGRDERYAHEVLAVALQYSEETNMGSPQHQRQTNFPTGRVKRCRVRVFERFEVATTDTGRRRLHRGFRLLAVTSPKIKSLSAASMDIGNLRPVVCDMTNDVGTGQQLPALTLHNMTEDSQTSLLVVFNDPSERQALLNLLTGVTQSKDEQVSCAVRLTSLLVEEANVAEAFAHSHTNPLRSMRWQDAMLIAEDGEQAQAADEGIVTESVRIVARGQGIGFTERLNLAPGELKIRLPATGASSTPSASLSILRPHDPAPSTTITAISSQPDPGAAAPFAALLELSRRQPTAQNYHFPSLADLHKFEAALTGHAVAFDGLASAFTISHRIALVPIHKRHGAHDVRIQVLRREGPGGDGAGSALLLAFFEGFALAEALCFKLLSTNVFELVEGDKRGSKKDSSGGGGEREAASGSWRYGVKLVDAKFSMPRLRRENESKDADGGDREGGGGGGGWLRHRRDRSRDSSSVTQSNSHTGNASSDISARADNQPRIDAAKVAERFVSVDMLEYAGEHDDIVIGFDDESVRAAFADALPAPASASRSISFKRRI